jgi:hypothetical protein
MFRGGKIVWLLKSSLGQNPVLKAGCNRAGTLPKDIITIFSILLKNAHYGISE